MDQQEELGRNIERMGQHLIGLLGLDDEEEVPQEQQPQPQGIDNYIEDMDQGNDNDVEDMEQEEEPQQGEKNKKAKKHSKKTKKHHKKGKKHTMKSKKHNKKSRKHGKKTLKKKLKSIRKNKKGGKKARKTRRKKKMMRGGNAASVGYVVKVTIRPAEDLEEDEEVPPVPEPNTDGSDEFVEYVLEYALKFIIERALNEEVGAENLRLEPEEGFYTKEGNEITMRGRIVNLDENDKADMIDNVQRDINYSVDTGMLVVQLESIDLTE